MPATQTAVLDALDAASDAASVQGNEFFRGFKGLAAKIYYSTEIGFPELNKGGRVPSWFGCQA